MALSKIAARKLTTQAEWMLLETSYPPMIKDITPGRLKQKITRARKLEDKYRDLAHQQRGEAGGKRRAKSTRPSAGNENTVAKQELFAEAVGRFEAQMDRLEVKAAKEEARKEKAAAKTAKSAKSTKSAARNTGTVAKRMAAHATATARKAVSKAARGPRKAAVFERSGSTKHSAHAGSRGRRTQGRRDAK